MLKRASLVADQKAKKEAIQLADPVNVSQVRHLRLLEKCQQVKKQDLSVKKTGSKKITYQHRRKKTTKRSKK